MDSDDAIMEQGEVSLSEVVGMAMLVILVTVPFWLEHLAMYLWVI